ncbi:hypothetical protein ACWJH8_08020 [Actinotignum schaalii]
MDQQDIWVSELSLDPENPRILTGNSNESPDSAMWRKVGHTIVKLAQDIASNGLNFSDRPYVIPDPKNGGYIVLEGNRRLIAIRAILDPEYAPEQYRSEFTKIHNSIDLTLFETIKCDVYESRESLKHWIELKHQGPMDGAGTVAWDPEEKYWHRRQNGKKRQFGGELWIWMDREYQSPDWKELLAKAKAGQWSFLNRLTKREFREKFKMKLTNGEISSEWSSRELERALKHLVQEIAEEQINSRKLHNNQKVTIYVQEELEPLLPESQPSLLPPQLPSLVSEQPAKAARTPDEKGKTSTVSTPRRTYTPKPKEDIRFLFDGIKFSGLPDRIHELAAQAQKLNLDEVPDIIGITIRVLVELLTEAYVKPSKETTLRKNVRTILESVKKHDENKYKSEGFKMLYDKMCMLETSVEAMIAEAHDFVHSSTWVGNGATVRTMSILWHPLVHFLVERLKAGKTLDDDINSGHTSENLP